LLLRKEEELLTYRKQKGKKSEQNELLKDSKKDKIDKGKKSREAF
jgi:hypothetical protein